MYDNYLLDKRNSRLLLVRDYLKEYYINKGFSLLPKNKFLRFFLIFFYTKFLRKIKILIKLLYSCEFIFKNPNQNKILILGSEGASLITIHLKSNEYVIVPFKINHFQKIFISKKILIFLFKNFHKNTLKVSYIGALINAIKPKIIITMFDQYLEINQIGKIFSNKIKLIAIQQANRSINHYPKGKLNFYKYYTIGDYEKKLTQNIIKPEKVHSIGSLTAIRAKEYFNLNKINLDIKHDICLLSEPHLNMNEELKDIRNVEESIGLVAEYTIQFCKKYDKKLIFSGKSDQGVDEKFAEEIFYKNNTSFDNLNIEFQNKKKFDTLKNIASSKLIIGCCSTALREAFEFNKKVLTCDFIGDEKTAFQSDGIVLLKLCTYEEFETRVNLILKMSYNDYLDNIKKKENIYNKSIDVTEAFHKELNSNIIINN